MKTKFTLIFLFVCSMSFGQSVVNQGSFAQAIHNLGGFWVDSALRIPVRLNTILYPNIPDLGTIQINSANNNFYYHNGTGYARVIDDGSFGSFFNTSFGGKTTDDLAEGSNLYFTDARARSAISLTTLGTSGAATYSLGILNIPVYPSGTVTSVGISSSTVDVSNSPVTTSGTININLPNKVTAGTYGIVTVDTCGRVTAGKRQETYSGTTNGSGLYTVTFGTAYASTPNIQFNIVGGAVTNIARVTAISTTGFTITANNRVDVIGLLPTYPVLSGANIDVLITED